MGQALYDAGVRCVETPLGSPGALESIAKLREGFSARMLIGAGTVLSLADLAAVKAAGAEFVVSPHADPVLIAATKAAGLAAWPGVFTPSEALGALEAGADGLKLFPGDAASPAYVRALRSVLLDAPIYPTGGVTPATLRAYWDAGASGFGIGTGFYRPGDTPESVRAKAGEFVRALREVTHKA